MPQNKHLKKVLELLRLFEGGAILAAIDTETTGLNPATDRLLEVGAVRFSKDGVIDTFNQLINPGCSIPYNATRINHITEDMVQTCPTEKEILPDLVKFVSNSILVAHNANFDLKFINTALVRCGHKSLSNRVEDTVKISRSIFPSLESHRLQFLAQHFNIDPGNAHRAQDDARVCMELLLICLQQVSEG